MICTQHNKLNNSDKKSPCSNIFAMVGSIFAFALSVMEGTDIAFSVASEPGLRFFQMIHWLPSHQNQVESFAGFAFR